MQQQKSGFRGWIKEFTGPESFENAQMEPPEEAMQRIQQAFHKVLGWRPKAKKGEPGPDDPPAA